METPGKNEEILSTTKISTINDMKIQLWYSTTVSRWRWTLTSDFDQSIMEAGDSEDLRDAMSDIANTVEWLLDKEA
jgi:hypothetical protein